jgi:Transposase IS66 family
MASRTGRKLKHSAQSHDVIKVVREAFCDDTPIPVLAPGTSKTQTGRLWTYVRDEHSHGGVRPPAVVFFVSPDHRGERPLAHLAGFSGVLLADGYAGINGPYEEAYLASALTEEARWAYVQRKIFDLHTSTARRWPRRRWCGSSRSMGRA